jgi:hypothetical protein
LLGQLSLAIVFMSLSLFSWEHSMPPCIMFLSVHVIVHFVRTSFSDILM